MAESAQSTLGARMSRLILVAAIVLTVLALAPLVISTGAIVIADVAGCALGSEPSLGCHVFGLELKPLLYAGVTVLNWSDAAWFPAAGAIPLWFLVFAIGLVRDIRSVRQRQRLTPAPPSRRAYLLIPLTMATIVGFGPIGCVVWAILFAEAFDCNANEGGASACLVGGVDYGGALSGLVVMGWFMFLVWPLALIVLVGWIVAVGYAFRTRTSVPLH
jgi:hypothetical protein